MTEKKTEKTEETAKKAMISQPMAGKPAEECPDGPRYKAIGNSMAVPVMRWIGERIAMADKEEPNERPIHV